MATWLCIRCSRPAELYELSDGRRRPFCQHHLPPGLVGRRAVIIDAAQKLLESAHEADGILNRHGLLAPAAIPQRVIAPPPTQTMEAVAISGNRFRIGAWVRLPDGTLGHINAEQTEARKPLIELADSVWIQCYEEAKLTPALAKMGEYWMWYQCMTHKPNPGSTREYRAPWDVYGPDMVALVSCGCFVPSNFGRGIFLSKAT